jgi:hypothetical protein
VKADQIRIKPYGDFTAIVKADRARRIPRYCCYGFRQRDVIGKDLETVMASDLAS